MNSANSQTMEQLKRAVLLHKLQKRDGIRKKDTTLPPILPADRSQALPLSWAQQRLWFLDQFDPAASIAYHIPAGLRLHGALDRVALQAALGHIVARHEDLRTTFVRVDGQPAQVIAPADIGFALLEHDLRPVSKPKQRTAVTRVSADEVSQPFDLSTGPLIRGQLLQLAEDEHILLITQHHIISDGWSFGLLVQEFSALYTAFSQGQPDPLPALGIQYADYAAWQRQWLQGDLLQAQIDFWQTHLSGAPALLELPTDRPRPAVQSYAGSSVEFVLSAALSADLKQLGQRHGSTLFMVLLTGWSSLMARLSGQDDIVIGTPVANRQRTEIEPLIGFFVNTLALRMHLDGDPNVAQLLNQVKATTLSAYAHQDIPFEQVMNIIKPERSLSHNPVFQVMMAMDNTPNAGELVLPGVSLSALELPHTTSQFDLSLTLTDTSEVIIGGLEYASELFDKATIERLAEHFQILLTGIVADEQQRISQLPLLTQTERRQLLIDFNGTTVDYPHDRLIQQLFEAQVQQTPDATALVYEGHSLSYRALNQQANRLAHYLLELGIRPDDRLALCVERSLDLVVGLLGILKAGGAYVPLDPGYPSERLAFMLGDSAPVAVLTQAALHGSLAGLDPTVPVVLLDAGTASGFSHYPDHNPDPHALGLTARHLAYVIYTSGSTGQPKGVMVEHKGLCNLISVQQRTFKITSSSHLLQFASCSFDACIWEISLSICSGARLHLASREALLPGESLVMLLQDHEITHAILPPSALATISKNVQLDHLHTLIVGGDVCSPVLAQHWAKQYHFFNAYGPTETTVCATTYYYNPSETHTLPIGHPIANTQIYILDAHLQPVPLGVTGEIYT